MVYKEKNFYNKLSCGCNNRLVYSSCRCGFCAELDQNFDPITRTIGSYSSSTNPSFPQPHPRTDNFGTGQLGEISPCCLNMEITNAGTSPVASSWCGDCSSFIKEYTLYACHEEAPAGFLRGTTGPTADTTCHWTTKICDSSRVDNICGSDSIHAFLATPDSENVYMYAYSLSGATSQSPVACNGRNGRPLFFRRGHVGEIETVGGLGNSNVLCRSLNVNLTETVPSDDPAWGHFFPFAHQGIFSDLCDKDSFDIIITSKNDLDCVSQALGVNYTFDDDVSVGIAGIQYDGQSSNTEGNFCFASSGTFPNDGLTTSYGRPVVFNYMPAAITVSISNISDNGCNLNVPCSSLNENHLLYQSPTSACVYTKTFNHYDFPPIGEGNYQKICCAEPSCTGGGMCLDRINFTYQSPSSVLTFESVNPALTFARYYVNTPIGLDIDETNLTGPDGGQDFPISQNKCSFSGINFTVSPNVVSVHQECIKEVSRCSLFYNNEVPESIIVTIPDNWKPRAIGDVTYKCNNCNFGDDFFFFLSRWEGFICSSCGFIDDGTMPVGSFVLNRGQFFTEEYDSSTNFNCDDKIVNPSGANWNWACEWYYYNPTRGHCCGINDDYLNRADSPNNFNYYRYNDPVFPSNPDLIRDTRYIPTSISGTPRQANICGWDYMKISLDTDPSNNIRFNLDIVARTKMCIEDLSTTSGFFNNCSFSGKRDNVSVINCTSGQCDASLTILHHAYRFSRSVETYSPDNSCIYIDPNNIGEVQLLTSPPSILNGPADYLTHQFWSWGSGNSLSGFGGTGLFPCNIGGIPPRSGILHPIISVSQNCSLHNNAASGWQVPITMSLMM